MEPNARRGTGQTVAGVERAFDVIDLFLADGVRDLGVTEIADSLGLSKAVVHRVLASFRAKELIELDEETRRYRLGVRALQFGIAYLNANDGLALARDRLADLSDATHETATLSVRDKWRRTYVAQATPTRDIKMEVQLGAPYPLHAGASSKALLAFMPASFQDAYLARGELERMTPETVVTVGALRAELARVVEVGYALSLGERQVGAGSVAAPVLDATGAPVAAVSVCGPADRMADEAEFCAAELLAVTQELSRRLGYQTS